MTHLLIDTCVWLDIAKTDKGEKLLSLLEEFLKEDRIELIFPSIIIEEFERNRERVLQSAKQSLSSHFKKIRELVSVYASNEETKQHILNELNNLDHIIPIKNDIASYSIERIETLFKQSIVLEINNEIKLRAAERAINKKAPFHLSKNSMADALIIESYIEFQKTNPEKDLIFVTHNTSDFSLINGNKKHPHEDLKLYFDKPNSKFYISLFDTLNDLAPDAVEEFDFMNNWELDPRGITEIWSELDELQNKIWYNRHKNREYAIKKGTIKLVDTKDFIIKNSQTTIVKSIWNSASATAIAVEQKYGKENLVWSDFEWGMMNGKLSALRWLLGEEWDNLDT